MSEGLIRNRLAELSIDLPAPWKLPPGVVIPAKFIRTDDRYAFLSGHLATAADGTVKGPFGKVGADVNLTEAQELATAAVLSLAATLESELGSLDRVSQWLRLDGLVNSAPGFTDFPRVFNPASEMLVSIFGGRIGQHSRIAYGVAGLPFDAPVEIAAIVRID